MRRSALILIIVLTALAAVPLGRGAAYGEIKTFHLTVGDVLASVGHTNAFLVSLGKQARGLKIVPGGTRFAGITCAGFGDVYQLGRVTVLDGPAAIAERVTTKKGKDAAMLMNVFGAAGVTVWDPPATETESDRQFWVATNVSHGVQFAAEGMATGTASGLLDASASAGIFRFRADVPPSAFAGAPQRFLLEIVGRTASNDGGLAPFGEQRCFTFVDVVPLDVSALRRIVNELLKEPYVRNGLVTRVETLEAALARRDYLTAFDVMAYIIGHLVARTPEHAEPVAARRVVAGVFDVRRGLDFRPSTAECGNGLRETGEACDGADLGGFTCSGLGYTSGSLTCEPSCFLNYEQCVANPVCGNGVLEINEECDNGTANSDAAPDGCRTNCKRAFCGDKVIDSFEDCEGRDLGGWDCRGLGYEGGALRCYAEFCEFNDESCDEGDFDHH